MGVAAQQQERVWARVDDEDAWVLATVEERFGGSVHLARLHAPPGVDKALVVPEEEFGGYTPATGDLDTPVDDLVRLNDVNQGALLHTLRLRYSRDEVYTSIGPILIAVNPFKKLEICSAETIARMASESAPADQLSSHIFKVVRAAFTGMVSARKAQSILISGESGAGKTETAKLSMSCLVEISESSGSSTQAALESALLLEAFGNARTVHNSNSSRFGRWCSVHFNSANRIASCSIKVYLLERSRVVVHGEGERNYHLFYYMCRGMTAEERETYKLLPAVSDYSYLRGDATPAEGDEGEQWRRLGEQLALLGFAEPTRKELFQLYAAVLRLGNIEFAPPADDGAEVSSPTMKIVDPKELETVASLLQVDSMMLSDCLVTKRIGTGRGSFYDVPLTLSQCADTRDGLAKALYARLFEWLVAQLNLHMEGTAASATTPADKSDSHFVGLLDVFGFENFEVNSYEQLCINYTNEKLQKHFIDYEVRLHIEDYVAEGIQCTHIAFPDNAANIDLIEGKNGVMGLLDDECSIPKGSEAAYVAKLHKAKADNPLYLQPSALGDFAFESDPSSPGKIEKKVPALKDPAVNKLRFGIQHYAEPVVYTTSSWLDKNRAFLQPELVKLLCSSDGPLLTAAFAPLQVAETARQPPSTGSAFRASLRELSQMINQTAAHFVRCIKPNREKVPESFAGRFVERQLRYTGVSAVTQMYRVGYPSSFLKREFVGRYKCLSFVEERTVPAVTDDDALCRNLLRLAQIGSASSWLDEMEVQLGKTKVFMRERVVKALELARQASWSKVAVHIQRQYRGHLARHTRKVVRSIKAGIVEVEAALEAKDADTASEKLSAVRAIWDGAKGLAEAVELLHDFLRQLASLDAQCQTLHLQKSLMDSLPEEAKAEGMEVVELKVSSEAIPLEGRVELNGFNMDVRLMTTVCKGGLPLGVQFNAANTVMSILKIGPAGRERKLRVGDIFLRVDGKPVKKTADIFADAADQGGSHTVVVARMHNAEADAEEAVPPADAAIVMAGWMMEVDAKDGRALRRPQNCYVVLEGGGALSWYEDKERTKRLGALMLLGARCSMAVGDRKTAALRTGKAQPDVALPSPVLQSFTEDYRKYPFILSWETGGPGHDLVFAAGSGVERAGWIAAVMGALTALQEGKEAAATPMEGWLMKQGGRKTGRKWGWKKRWFVLPPEGDRLAYYIAPGGANPKSVIPLEHPADVFRLPDQHIKGPSGFPHAFCVTTRVENMTQTVVLAASSIDDLESWYQAIQRSLNKRVLRTRTSKAMEGKAL